MNEEAQEALDRYREIKSGMAAVSTLMLELEMMAWSQFIDALEDADYPEEKEKAPPFPGKCCY